jgi:hypothetical protein
MVLSTIINIWIGICAIVYNNPPSESDKIQVIIHILFFNAY